MGARCWGDWEGAGRDGDVSGAGATRLWGADGGSGGAVWRVMASIFSTIIDGIIIYIPVVLLATSLGLGDVESGDGSFSFNLGGGGVGLNIAISVLYNTILLTLLNGRTIGKLLFGMHVVGMNGKRISSARRSGVPS